jgi:hypothetical protein
LILLDYRHFDLREKETVHDLLMKEKEMPSLERRGSKTSFSTWSSESYPASSDEFWRRKKRTENGLETRRSSFSRRDSSSDMIRKAVSQTHETPFWLQKSEQTIIHSPKVYSPSVSHNSSETNKAIPIWLESSSKIYSTKSDPNPLGHDADSSRYANKQNTTVGLKERPSKPIWLQNDEQLEKIIEPASSPVPAIAPEKQNKNENGKKPLWLEESEPRVSVRKEYIFTPRDPQT